MSLYSDTGLRQCHGDRQTVHPVIPQEMFYTDPTMTRGRRMINHINEPRDFDCFQLNTPSPIMSTCPASPNCSDPFRNRQHFTRNLGCSSRETSGKLPPVNCMYVVIQLTQEEDETMTSLLRLHHGEGRPDQSGVQGPQADCSKIPNEQIETHSASSHWSDTEMEVANTLITQLGVISDNNV
ncbi:unnamed protein product [Knipowitschia caucasica]